jgi:RHS repeat-associated protein
LGRSDYRPFGETWGQTGTLPRQRFTGQARDGEADLDDFNARAYQPRFGRFTRPDPVSGNLFQPQSWNMYAYAQNRPLVLTDTSGLDPQNRPSIPECPGCPVYGTVTDVKWVPSGGIGGAMRENHQRADPGPSFSTSFTLWALSSTLNLAHASERTFGQGHEPERRRQQGGTQGPTIISSDFSSLIPGIVKGAIAKSVVASNQPGPTDPTGKKHEEGGVWGRNADGSIFPIPAYPGPMCTTQRCVIDVFRSPFEALNTGFVKFIGTWHVHPDGPWGQSPSADDLASVSTYPAGMHLVIGAGNQRIYLYATSSIVAQMSLRRFLR